MYSRSKRRIKKNSTPKLKEELSDIKEYDIIFIGYPIWFGIFPCPLLTQLQKLDFENKIIIPFCTNEGSGIEGSLNNIKKIVKVILLKKVWVLKEVLLKIQKKLLRNGLKQI